MMFRYKLVTSDGTNFENLFTELMQYRFPNFKQIKPYGNIGDRKNDGFRPDEGIYYQVFAPEDVRRPRTVVDAVNKLEEDLEGLIQHWKGIYPAGIKEFYFVVNDKFYNAPEPVHTKLEELRQQHSLDVCDVITDKDLERYLGECSDDQIITLIGFLPSPETASIVDYDDISQVVGFILANKPSKVASFRETPPDFERKIAFNGLRVAERLLKDAEYLIALIEQYFDDMGGEFQKFNIQNRLKEIYEESKRIEFVSSDTYTESDMRFLYILEKINPAQPNSQNFADLEAASIGMMAVFFETCHIFEDPEKVEALVEGVENNVGSG